MSTEQSYNNHSDTGETTSSTDSQQNVQQQGTSNSSTTGTTTNATTNKPAHASKQMNLQRIQQLKQKELGLPYTKKLLKLAVYSKCQVRFL